ncbi:hypothetical protein KR018_011296 [Drosophila ironensis]|nr:hypothetical protein KR018_011296 [Drosophila ironensis]
MGEKKVIGEEHFQEDASSESLSLRKRQVSRKRLDWYYAPSFLLLWVALFYAIVIPLFNRLPEKVTLSEESVKPGEFIGERAQNQLYVFDRIGYKHVGSIANEVKTVEFLLKEIEKIRSEMRSDLYDLEVDVQSAKGGFVLTRIRLYQGIQNVVVKLKSKSYPSENYLLLNSHFDSKPNTPSSGDDGTMVVVMLEVLRQMAISETPFEHPIVFLFNGAEENGLMGSHAFITQHKWAPNCKWVESHLSYHTFSYQTLFRRAYINLEVGGSGGRDVLFQSGPQHSWLMKYYRSYAKHPFATTMGEEIFQSGILPSDTDFRIFRDYGNIPGLDIAQAKNGYVYHTIFDSFKTVPGRSIQNTGNNILALVRAYSNATELNDIESEDNGHAVFFDYLGLFFVYYTETTGIILNCVIGVFCLVLVGVSIWRMSRLTEKVTLKQVSIWFGIILALHAVGFVLCLCLPLLMAVMFDAGDRSLTYFTNNWLVFGLYISPAVIGLVLPLTLYYTLRPNDKLSHAYNLQLSLHAHLVLLTIVAFILTGLGYRSQYLCLMSMIFYSGALVINLLSKLHDRGGYYWALIVMCLQVFPFCYFCYLFYLLLVVFFPIVGRSGSASNPDITVAFLCGCAVVFALGFTAQFINMFRWPKLILLGLGVVTFIFCMLAVSDIGFPYHPKTNVMRVSCIHTRRIFYEYDGSVSHSDSGYYFNYQDRRTINPLKDTALNLTGLVPVKTDCDKYVMCGVPCFAWCAWRKRDGWLPRDSEVIVPGEVTLDFLGKTVSQANGTVRFDFQLSGPQHMNIFIQAVGDAAITDWSFDRKMIDNPDTYEAPYQVYRACGTDNSPLQFNIEIKEVNGNFEVPVLELGVVGHFISPEYARDAEAQKFVANFPDFAHVTEWPSIFKRYVF